MSETLSEFEGCSLLARLFSDRGYTIERNVMFREYGVEFHIDGWDKEARVGFEFLTSEDDDHDDLSLEEYKAQSAPYPTMKQRITARIAAVVATWIGLRTGSDAVEESSEVGLGL